jgi:hypothetical protein
VRVQGLPLPPWRRARSVLTKWGLAPAPAPARDPPAPLASPSKRLAANPDSRPALRAGGGGAQPPHGAGAADAARRPVARVRGGSSGGRDARVPQARQAAAGPGAGDARGEDAESAGHIPAAARSGGAVRGGGACDRSDEGEGGPRDAVQCQGNSPEAALKPRPRVVSLLARGLAGEGALPAPRPGPRRLVAGDAAEPGGDRANWDAELPVVRTVRRVGRER